MNAWTLVFLAMLAIATLVELWLARRQLRHVGAHRDTVPAAFAGHITAAQHHKAADYTRSRTRLEITGIIYQLTLLLAWTLGGGIAHVDDLWRAFELGPLATGTGVIASVILLNSLLHLPLTVYRVFVIEQRFGFNHTKPMLFVTDLCKNALVTLLLGVPLIAGALLLMEPAETNSAAAAHQTDPWWWLHAWLLWLGFSLLMLWIYPRFIAPLFNSFVPLQNAELTRRIQALLQRCGFSGSGVFVMDGSRRSAHGNAYFTGLGANKRIVFFDTLLDALTPAEIEAVLAHELGHFKLRHIHKRIVASALTVLAALLLLDQIIDRPDFYAGLGVTQASNHAALLLFAFAAPVCGFFLQPFSMHLSRKHEYEADAFAASQTRSAELRSALVKLYRDNASTLTPDPLYSAFHHSHPQAAARIAHLPMDTA